MIFLTVASVSCNTTKTTKVYIEVGVNDYTKRNANAQNNNTKTKKVDSGSQTPGPSQPPTAKKAPK